MRDVAINRIMTTGPATVGPDDPVATAKQILESGKIHHLPVVEDRLLVGIVSSSDLLVFHFLDSETTALANAPVRQIMESEPVALDSGASLRDAATRLAAGAYHALPVIESDRTLVGIVTTCDLIDHLLHQIPSGDGSIQSEANCGSMARPSDSEISTELRNARMAAERGEGSSLAQVLLYLRDRNRLLQQACQAAEHYLRSGFGEHEHSVLVKRLADLQESGNKSGL